jgi:hypothetical protein
MKKKFRIKKRELLRISLLVLVIALVWAVVNFIVSLISVQDSFIVLGLQYLSNGLLISLAAALTTFFFFNWFFEVLDDYVDNGDFSKDWKTVSPEVRVCVTIFVVAVLFLSFVLAFKP